MTGTHDAAAAARDDVRLLAGDLAYISGTLSEIATMWRRAWQSRPDLPIGLPVRLQDTTRQLAVDIQELASAGQGQPPGRALFVASQLSALKDDITSAQAMTCGPGMPPAGDAALWNDLSAALNRAGNQLPGLILHLATTGTGR
jgi:hypothetical protein